MANDVKVGGALLEVKASDNKALKVINNFVNIVDKLGQQIQKTGQAASNQASKATAAVDAQAKKTKQFAYTVTSSSKEVVKGVDSWGKAVDGYKTKINSSEKATTKSTSKIKQGFDDLSKKATGSINTIQKGFTAFGNSVKRVVTEPKQAMRDLGQTATTAASKIKGAFTSGFARIKNSSQDSSKSMSSDIKDFAKRSVQSFNDFRNRGTEAFLANRREAKSFKDEADKSTFSVKKLVGAIGLLKAGAMVFSKLGAAAGKALARIDVTEQFNRNMTVMLGTKKAAQELYDEVRKIVTGTAYGLDTALNAAKSFTTSGLDNVPKIVGGWADAVAFFGDGTDETFQRVTYQLGQMAAKGKANLGDLMSATEAGIPVTQLYAAATGKSVEEVSKALSSGNLTADEFFKTMDKVFTEGAGKFPAIAGAATKAGNSWKGVFDNFNAGLTRGMQSMILAVDEAVIATGRADLRTNIAAIGKLAESSLNGIAKLIGPTIQLIDLILKRIKELTIVQQVIKLITDLANSISKHLPTSAKIFDLLSKAVNKLFDWIEKLTPVLIVVASSFAALKIVSLLSTAFGVFTGVVGALNLAFVTLSNVGLAGTIKMLLGFANPVTLIIGAIAGVGLALVYLYKKSEAFRNIIDPIANALKTVLGQSLDFVSKKFTDLGRIIGKQADKITDTFKAIKAVASGDITKDWELFKFSPAIADAGWVDSIMEIGKKLEPVATVFDTVGFAIKGFFAILSGQHTESYALLDFIPANVDVRWTDTIYNAAQKLMPVKDFFKTFGDVMKGFFAIITGDVNTYAELFTKLHDTLSIKQIDGLYEVMLQFQELKKSVVDSVTAIFDAIGKAFQGDTGPLLEIAANLLPKIAMALIGGVPYMVYTGMKLVTKLADGMGLSIPDLLKKVTKIITDLVYGFSKALPKIVKVGTDILQSVIKGIVSALPIFLGVVITLLDTVVTLISENLPILLEAGIQMLTAIVDGIILILPALLDAALMIITELLLAITENLPMILDAGIKILMALINGIITILPALIAAAIKIIVTLITVITQNLPKIIQAGIKILITLIQGIIQVLPQLIAAAFKIIGELIKAILKNLPQILKAGATLILELVKGVLSIMGALLKAGGDLAAGLLRTILGFGGKMLNAGGTLISKMVQGIRNGIKSVGDAARSIGNALLKPINGAVNGVLKGINWVLDKVGADKKLELWTLPKFEKGSKGLARDTIGVVNDGPGRNYQEIIKEPGKDPYMFKGRNIVAPLKKGTEIVPGHATAEIMKDKRVPKFKKGTGGFWSGLKDGVVNVGKKIKDTALDVWDYVSHPSKLVDKAVEMFTDTTGIIQPWLSGVTGSIKTVKNGAMDMVVGFIEDMFSSSGDFDGSVGAHGVYSYLVDAAKKTMAKFPGMSVTSGYRPGDPYSHGKRQAIDIAYPAGMNGSSRYFDPANWVYEKFPKLISYVITQGKVRDRSGMSGTGSSGQWRNWPDNDHYDHLHINGLLGAGDIYKSTGDGGKQGAGVERWRSTAIKALKMEGQYSAANLNALLYQMKTESGGNPRAINNWDINAMNGTPSKGLMQVIDPTFRANARPGFNSNIYDPLSNILASIRYAVRRYGSLTNAYRGVGYANGGWVDKDGLYRMGEGNQPEVVIPVTKPRLAIPLILEALNFMGLGAKSVLAQVSDSLMGASTGLSFGSLSNSYNGLSGSMPNPGQNNGGALNELVGLVRGLREDIDNGKIGVYIDKKTTGAVLFDENDKLGGDMTRLNERGVLQ